MILPNNGPLPEDEWPLEELDTHPGDPTRPPLKGYWLGSRKPTQEQALQVLNRLDAIRARTKPSAESVQELHDEGRRV